MIVLEQSRRMWRWLVCGACDQCSKEELQFLCECDKKKGPALILERAPQKFRGAESITRLCHRVSGHELSLHLPGPLAGEAANDSADGS